ncbi:helix-turn-helix transcriptional regulator [Actinomadura parmotrematis]|uniref:Helix-turn-helix domain-containing protein n=1 Tax=Actinomadura parmotrematis TaxID=2864039 RepID=A0ABS7FLZ0_9ACTN|nr:helix-turn-helix transcriptional regulator [Actinomadura parmotrematis]MBW8481402.1 helix-turn-helix domain-containing protein [Actinomadura parmotrematis]
MNRPDPFWTSAPVQAAVRAGDFGRAVRLARERQGRTQAELAAAAGYSRSTVSRVETGAHATLDLGRLRAVADVLDMPEDVFGALFGLEIRSTVTVVSQEAAVPGGDDPMRRRTLLTAGLTVGGLVVPAGLLSRLDETLLLMPDLDGPASPRLVAARLAAARARWDQGAVPELLVELPDLLALAHRTADERGGPEDLAAAAGAYDLAAETLDKVGAAAPSQLAADRAVGFAERSGDAVAAAWAARARCVVLRHQGRTPLAQRIMLRAAAQVERTGLRTGAERGAYAQMLATCAYTAAQDGKGDDAVALLDEAAQAARGLPAVALAGRRTPISAAQVRLYLVGVQWALGDAGAALAAARPLRASMFSTPERRARMHTDTARALVLGGRHEAAVTHLLAAHRHAPAEVNGRSAIRREATRLVRDHRGVAGARELAGVLGDVRSV